MNMVSTADTVAPFERTRPRLFGIAYRMLGTIEDGEDIVQEAFLRWQQADREQIREPEGWLVSVVTRLSIDRLRRARTERDAYVGHWLPEPLPTGEWGRPDERSELASDLSVAFLFMLERLGPEERAALLLREVFDCGYPELARVLEKSEVACRQLVHRARVRVRRDQPRFPVSHDLNEEVVGRFLAALHAEDKDALLALVADDATWISDGGGKVSAVRNMVRGADAIVRMMLGFQRKETGLVEYRVTRANNELAWLCYYRGTVAWSTFFETDGSRIRSVYRLLNPDKLRHLAAAPTRAEAALPGW